MSSVIEVNGLSKQYRIGTAERRPETFAGYVKNAILSPLTNYRKIRDLARKGGDDENVFWALKDISFNVAQGEVLAIIGKNGAGKSTLLKILSRITDPTQGEVKIKGRIAALLEVGTGFHPELTGRENVYMNGTILGMTRREINLKFDEIVEFSGVSKFVDTPVKFYSSGMKVRLGFAVAAHLDPEILIVDEVLSVGDAEFQRKAIGKMKDVTTGEGRTVLFVSHNLRAVTQLCSKSIILTKGIIEFEGDVHEAVRRYVKGENVIDNSGIYQFETSKSNILQLDHATLTDGVGNIQNTFTSKDRVIFNLVFEIKQSLRGARIGLQLENDEGIIVFVTTNATAMGKVVNPGMYTTQCELPTNLLNEGNYHVKIFAGVPGQTVLFEQRNIFQFFLKYLEPRGALLPERWQGIIVPSINWDFIQN